MPDTNPVVIPSVARDLYCYLKAPRFAPGDSDQEPAMPHLSIRIDFDDEGRLGPGKVALLEGIAREGSISAAGRAMNMSYKRAWELVSEINRTFEEPLVTAQTG